MAWATGSPSAPFACAATGANAPCIFGFWMDAVEIEVGTKPGGPRPTAAVIWLHGLGADGHDFEPIVPELRLPKPVRFVFPHAPIRAVTINQGMRMRAWYDIFQFGGGPEDEAGLRASQKLVDALVKQQPVPASKVV